MTASGPIKRILLFVDGSEQCITAAQYGIVLARHTGAQLHALYVINASVLDELVKARIFIKIEEIDYLQDMERDGKRYLHYIARMAEEKDVQVSTELVKGVVNKEVIRKVKELGVDLLIMGELEPVLSRSDTFHDEAELIFRKAHCSVLVVKDPDQVESLFSSL